MVTQKDETSTGPKRRADRFRQQGPVPDPVKAAFSYVTTQTSEAQPSAEQVSAQVVLPPWLQHFQMIPIDHIRPGRYQTRLSEAVDQITYEQLETQMRTSYERGTLHLFIPVMPDPDEDGYYNPAQGMHRRIEIARKIGIAELPCYVDEYDRENLALGTFFENMGRQDLNIVEKGLMFLLVIQDFGWSQEQVAQQFKVPGGRDHVARCVLAAEYAPDIQAMILKDPDRSMRVAGILARLDTLGDVAAQKRAPIIEAFLRKDLTADEVDIAVKQVLTGRDFTLDESEGSASSSVKVVKRIVGATSVRKKADAYLKSIGDEPPGEEERAELELAIRQLSAVLARQ